MLQKIRRYLKLNVLPIFYNRKLTNNETVSENLTKAVETFGLAYPNDFRGFEYMESFKYYDRGLSRIVKKIKDEKYNNLSLIDIGANIGDSIAVLRQSVFCPILAVEGDDVYFDYLKKNTQNYQDVELIKAYLGEKDELLNIGSVRKDGTAHLEKSNESREILSLDTVLKDSKIFKFSKFLKIDTDGYDNAILRGSVNYLALTKPIIFMEYHPDFLEKQNDYGIDIFDYLTSLGYEKAIMYENYGEYMFSFNIANKSFIEEMREFFYKNERIPYCDLTLFHKDDNDLFQIIRKSELDFFKFEKIK